MKRIFLTIEYDGSEFYGVQKQDGKRTIQDEIEKALCLVVGHHTKIVLASRTDRGVHALGQTAHFDTESNITAEKFAKAINNFLPDDVKIMSSSLVGNDFHARYSATKKTYKYQFYTSKTLHPLKDKYSLQVLEKFDYVRAKNSLQSLIGTFDFANLSSKGSSVKTTTRTVYDVSLTKTSDEDYVLTITGDGFLYNMVRKIVGTMLQIASGKKPINYFELLLFDSDKSSTFVANAKALTLVKIYY